MSITLCIKEYDETCPRLERQKVTKCDKQRKTISIAVPYNFLNICDALRDLVAFVQFKNCVKQPWRSVTFSKIAG